LWDLDYIKIYAETVQGLADYAQKFMYFASLPALNLSLNSEGLDGAARLL